MFQVGDRIGHSVAVYANSTTARVKRETAGSNGRGLSAPPGELVNRGNQLPIKPPAPVPDPQAWLSPSELSTASRNQKVPLLLPRVNLGPGVIPWFLANRSDTGRSRREFTQQWHQLVRP